MKVKLTREQKEFVLNNYCRGRFDEPWEVLPSRKYNWYLEYDEDDSKYVWAFVVNGDTWDYFTQEVYDDITEAKVI